MSAGKQMNKSTLGGHGLLYRYFISVSQRFQALANFLQSIFVVPVLWAHLLNVYVKTYRST